MAENRPHGRERNETGSASVFKRGEGLGTGPAGSSFRPGNNNGGSRNRGPGSLVTLLVIIAMVIFGGKSGLSALLSGDTGSSSSYPSGWTYGNDQISNSGNYSVSTIRDEKPDYTVSSLAREKYTDTADAKNATVLVYMCGADLESRSGMATKDIQEMVKAEHGDNVKIILETGGASRWQNSVISADTIQRWRVVDNGLEPLDEDVGNASMTDPETLRDFVDWGLHNYRSDRNILVLWDHGGGSVSGYGYDEKLGSSSSMTLGDIKKALDAGGIKYDVIGFDACLMATVENALMLSDYADYMIASEETEPGIGWYYTDWLTKLSRNTSMPTTELGKTLIDSFITACNSRCPGQQTTLSLVDLAELGETVGDDFKAFASSTAELISGDGYQTVATARGHTREFAKSTRIDQIDLVHFAKNLRTKEGDALADVLLSAVKYNRTSSNMTNAYGLSIYFPTRRVASLDKALKTYQDIGLDDAYGDCIREFAAQQTTGQYVAGSQQGSYGSLFEALMGGSASYGGSSSGSSSSYGGSSYGGSSAHGSTTAYGGGEDLAELFSMLFRSGGGSGDRAMAPEAAEAYAEANSFDPEQLVWTTNAEGKPVIALDEEQWRLLTEVNLNMFIDTGNGWFDLGLDNLFEIGDDGTLIADTSGTWLTVDGIPMAYYHTDTTENDGKYTITGYVPAVLNDERVDLILIFDTDNPNGFFAGAKPHYDELTQTETVARGLTELQNGDEIRLLYDHYGKDGNFDSLYASNSTVTVSDQMTIGDMKMEGDAMALYKLTDIYQQNWWTPVIP